MRTWSFAAFATTLLAFGTALADAPFGFESNAHPSDYDYCEATGLAELYKCESSPRPHTAFDLYFLHYVDGLGLCKLSAVGKSDANDNYGTKSRQKADELAQEISRKYGPHTNRRDFLPLGSFWDEPRYWMMGVYVGDRYYAYYWTEAEGYKKVGDVTAIQVAVRAASFDLGYVVVTFEMSAISRCVERKEQSDSDAF